MKTTVADFMEEAPIISKEEDEDTEEIFFNEEDEEENGLSYWEFINGSDFSSQDGHGHNRSVDTLSLDSLPSWHSSASVSVSPTVVLEDILGFRYKDRESNDLDDAVNGSCYHHEQDDDEACDDDDDGDDDDDDGYLDDELVPWHLSGKLGRNRMRKLGKKSSMKMINSAKRNPYRYVKPGCVHGKHGLGVKVGCLRSG